jgi:hypothetical protein
MVKKTETAGNGDAAGRRFRSISPIAGRLGPGGPDRRRGLRVMIGGERRWIAGTDEFGDGATGRPIDVADENAGQSQQDDELDQQGSNNRRPIDAAILWTGVTL